MVFIFLTLNFRSKKQTERSIEVKCEDWKVEGTRDFEWSRDLGDLVLDWKALKAIEMGKKRIESLERFDRTAERMDAWNTWRNSHPPPSHNPAQNDKTLPRVPQIEARSENTNLRSKIELPSFLTAEAADVCGLKDLGSEKTSIEDLQGCMKKRVSSWYKGV